MHTFLNPASAHFELHAWTYGYKTRVPVIVCTPQRITEVGSNSSHPFSTANRDFPSRYACAVGLPKKNA